MKKEILEKLLLEIRYTSSRRNFPAVCGDLFKHLDTTAAGNKAYEAFEADRKAKWSAWGPERLGVFELPADREERVSLAYGLFRSVGEQNDDGSGLLHSLYFKRRFDENIDHFRDDFLSTSWKPSTTSLRRITNQKLL